MDEQQETCGIRIHECPLQLRRKAKATASLKGDSLNAYIIEAIKEKVERDSETPGS